MIEISKDKILECRQNNVAQKFDNAVPAIFKWNAFINHLSYCFGQQDHGGGNYGSKEVIGAVNFWHKLTVTLEQVSEQTMPGVQSIIDILEQHHPDKYAGSFAIISFTNVEPNTAIHSDPIDVIYCQFIGTANWHIYDEKDNKINTFTLNPGDAIYCPDGVTHEVESLTPRAAISFMFQ